MKQKILNFIEKGIDINILKSIAVFTMLFDHVGYYFQMYIPNGLYTILRVVGRITMPVFVYVLVQGFFHTKSIKKYIIRIFSLAAITQLGITIIGILNIYMVKGYNIGIYKTGNILFSFGFGLILLNFIHNKIVFKKLDFNKNMIIKIVYVISLIGIYIFIPIDYSIKVILLIVLFYYIEKFKISFYLSRQSNKFDIKHIVSSSITEKKMRTVYIALILLAMLLIIFYCNENWFILLSLPFIYLYNGEKNKIKRVTDSFFYIFFPAHHVLLYSLAVIIAIIK